MPLSISAVRELIAAHGALGPLISVGLLIIHAFIPFPMEIVAFANGLIFGTFWGIVVTWAGSVAGAAAAFALARRGGRPLVMRFMAPKHVQAFDRWVERYGTIALLLLRMLPVVPFNLLCYAAGLSRVTLWNLLWTTGVGILPMTLLMVTAGDQMGRRNSLGWWLLALLALLGVLAWVWKRRRDAAERAY